jgi:hypothetical protein
VKAIRPEKDRDRVMRARPDLQPVAMQLCGVALERLTRRLLCGERVEIAESPPSLQNLLLPSDSESGTQEYTPTLVPHVPLP